MAYLLNTWYCAGWSTDLGRNPAIEDANQSALQLQILERALASNEIA
jgi:hypothetical protein